MESERKYEIEQTVRINRNDVWRLEASVLFPVGIIPYADSSGEVSSKTIARDTFIRGIDHPSPRAALC